MRDDALADGPAEGGLRRFLVFEADVALVAEFAAAGDPFAEGKLPGSGSPAAGVVGDLDVAEVLGVLFDDGGDVVTVDGQVVEVGEELDVLRAGFVLDPGDDVEGVLGREQRVAGCAADGFQEDGAADAGDAGGRGREVFGANGVLLLGGFAVNAVAVEGVEGLAAEALTDAGDDVDVVLEFGGAGRPGDQAAVTARHVARVEVQAGELHAGVGDGVLKPGNLGVGGDGGLEGPPEFDGVKTGGLRRGRAFPEGELRQEDGAVHGVRHCGFLPVWAGAGSRASLPCRSVFRYVSALWN